MIWYFNNWVTIKFVSKSDLNVYYLSLLAFLTIVVLRGHDSLSSVQPLEKKRFIPRRSSDSSVFTWYPRPADSNLWIMSSVCLQDNNFAAIREILKYTKLNSSYYYCNVLAILVSYQQLRFLTGFCVRNKHGTFLNSIFFSTSAFEFPRIWNKQKLVANPLVPKNNT